ncbi:hypothetical protein EJ08DRAFT_702925 [Tothia fuscella]|uniref:Uncharacterized protein n=1 Tax=Tothia fuscella TaxID=1048955 RepID=A0A9P4NFV0_9PEZI|nr:hypothetical protein EJ08DRAFT_702925 [Tothia fuscella]
MCAASQNPSTPYLPQESSTFRLTELPIEIFKQVLEHFVKDSGMARTVRLRHVSKLFAREVNLAICSTRLLETRAWRFVKVEHEFFTEYLVKRFQKLPNEEDKLSSAVREAVAEAVKLDGHSNNRTEYTRILWSAAVREMSPLQIFGCINPEALGTFNTMTPGYYEVSNSLVAAAALLGKSQIIDSASRSELSISNQFFGFPLTCAAAAGHQHLVSIILAQIGNDSGRIDVTHALKAAASRGNAHMVKLVLEKYLPLTSEDSVCLLRNAVAGAAGGGHGHVIYLLLNSTTKGNLSKCFKYPITATCDLEYRILLAAA